MSKEGEEPMSKEREEPMSKEREEILYRLKKNEDGVSVLEPYYEDYAGFAKFANVKLHDRLAVMEVTGTTDAPLYKKPDPEFGDGEQPTAPGKIEMSIKLYAREGVSR